jgi:hypothetical protein
MALPPLRWIAEEPLRSDPATNELHRADCTQASGRELAQGEALMLVWAPKICFDCRPRVTLGLGATTETGPG